MERTVYGVSTGEYSDYQVEVLFEDRADAERHAEARRADFAYPGKVNVEEFALLGGGVQPARLTIYGTEVIIDEAGAVTEEREWSNAAWSHGGWTPNPGKRPQVNVGQAPSYRNGWYVRVSGRTREAVMKVTHDQVAQKRAELLQVSP
jgi:hypothetical protein